MSSCHSHGPCCCQPATEERQPDDSHLSGTPCEVFLVSGMDCSEEVAAIERALKPLEGIRGVRADLVTSKVTVFHDGSLVRGIIAKHLEGSGVRVRDGQQETGAPSWPAILVGISGLAWAVGFAVEWGNVPSWLSRLSFLVAILAGGWLVAPKAFRSLRTFSLDMNVLMSVAVLGAIAIDQLSEGAAVVFLFSLSALLESWSVGRARRAIQALMNLTPDVAIVKRKGEFLEVPAQDVSVGEIVIVKSGQKVPLDGIVISGLSSIDQAPITGESMPVEKNVGSPVFAGTINGDGFLEVKTTQLAGNTTMARILKMVQESQETKAPVQRFVDVFAKYYTPAVMISAVLVGILAPLVFGELWRDGIYRALVLLVIACPCALVISTPVSVVAGLTILARRGVLVKGGAPLEALGRLRALAMDKTGTITEGKPRVLNIYPFSEGSSEEVLRIAAAIEVHSTHPLAQAVVSHAKERGVPIETAENYQARVGKGAEARINGHDYFVGSHRFAHELGVCSDKLEALLSGIEGQAHSVVVVGHRPHGACTGDVLGILSIGDRIRANAAEAICEIHAAGIRKIILLSGDNSCTASAIAEQVGLDEAWGDLLPEAKIAHVQKLASEFGKVGMIGDGVNDAPALAAADVGIAMGAIGTDAAIETADVALMRDDLMMVSQAIRLGRRTLATIRFNIAFALSMKVVFLILAVTGHATLWMAVLADTGATLLVIANALRLLLGTEGSGSRCGKETSCSSQVTLMQT